MLEKICNPLGNIIFFILAHKATGATLCNNVLHVKLDSSYLEPLFYRGRGITVSDAVFTIIWRVFSAPKKN